MFIALDSNGKRIDVADAKKGNDYFCPVCNNPLRIKEGKIKIKHFAHFSTVDCDDFSSDMSEWHRRWQEQFPLKNREVVIEHNGEKHRADVLAYGHVIEFQHSPISLDEFERRNKFYTSAGKKVVWIFDLTKETSGGRIFINKEIWKGKIQGYQWFWIQNKRIFQHFSPQEQKNVILFFQLNSANFCEEDKPDYIKRVIWAPSCNEYVSFDRFQTIPFPGTKSELLDWIKNRKSYDQKEQELLTATPVTSKKQQRKPQFAQSKKIPSAYTFASLIPKPTTTTLKLDTSNIPRDDFYKDIIVQDTNGTRVLLCTECNQVFREADMSIYQYSKGVCRTCMRKKESFSP